MGDGLAFEVPWPYRRARRKMRWAMEWGQLIAIPGQDRPVVLNARQIVYIEQLDDDERRLRDFFGGRSQVAVAVVFLAATAFQAVWWGAVTRPSTTAIFWLSIEALFFAAWVALTAALGYRATERVESVVVEQADQVDIET